MVHRVRQRTAACPIPPEYAAASRQGPYAWASRSHAATSAANRHAVGIAAACRSRCLLLNTLRWRRLGDALPKFLTVLHARPRPLWWWAEAHLNVTGSELAAIDACTGGVGRARGEQHHGVDICILWTHTRRL